MTLKYRSHLSQFSRPALVPFGREGKIGLDKNEAPFSLKELCPEAATKIDQVDLRTYPDPYPLYEKLAKFLEVERTNLLLTFGSEQAIRFSFELMINKGDQVVYISPTFAMVDVFSAQFEATKKLVEFDDSLKVSVAQVIDAISPATRLIVIANPNNPTGTVFSEDELEMISKRALEVGALFLIDEAYHPYSSVTGMKLALTNPNVVVTRSFSKGWGLAGVRVGYIVGKPETITLFRKLKPIDEVSAPSLMYCLLALDHPEILAKNRNQVDKWKEKFSQLSVSGIEPLESNGNFVLFKVSPERKQELTQYFKEQSIIVKTEFGYPCMAPYIRFSISTDGVMSKVHEYMKNLR